LRKEVVAKRRPGKDCRRSKKGEKGRGRKLPDLRISELKKEMIFLIIEVSEKGEGRGRAKNSFI